MRFDQIQWNDAATLTTAQSAIVLLPIEKAETVKKVTLELGDGAGGSSVFKLQKNGVDVADLDLSFSNGTKRIGVTANFDLVEGDIVTLDFVSGEVSAPITLGLGFDEKLLLPTGGTTGQMLVKQSNADGDVIWIDPPPTWTAESLMDLIFSHISAGGSVTINYDDASDNFIISAPNQRTNEEIMDVIAAMLKAGNNITLSYNDPGDELTINAAGGGGTTIPAGDLNASTNKVEKLNSITLDLSGDLSGKDGFALKYDKSAGKISLQSPLSVSNVKNILANFNDGTSGQLVNQTPSGQTSSTITGGKLVGNNTPGRAYDDYQSAAMSLSGSGVQMTVSTKPSLDQTQTVLLVTFTTNSRYCRIYLSGSSIVADENVTGSATSATVATDSAVDGTILRMLHDAANSTIQMQYSLDGGQTWKTLLTSRNLAANNCNITSIKVDVQCGNYGGDGSVFAIDDVILTSAVLPIQGYPLHFQALATTLASNNTYYAGQMPRAMPTTANTNKVYIARSGIIGAVIAYTRATGTAGTGEKIQCIIRINNTTNYLVSEQSVAGAERTFTNSQLNIPVNVGDFFEILFVCQAFATAPTAFTVGGYAYVQ